MKFTDEILQKILTHNKRITDIHSNPNIDSKRSALNYSIPHDHQGLKDLEYYKKRLNETYIYGRGTKRESATITGCSWVVTLPKELYGNTEKERLFFHSVFDFICLRYGAENILFNHIHYDEDGLPHIHVAFCPVTTLDHEKVQYKTYKTKETVRLESGRYEYVHQFKLNSDGTKIKLKNYAKMTDFFNEKLDCNTVMNRMELKTFHGDLQQYLTEHNVDGKVKTGATGGVNFTVSELKEFTQKTGLHLDQLKEISNEKSILLCIVDQDQKLKVLEQLLEEKDIQLSVLKESLQRSNERIHDLESQLSYSKESDLSWGKTNTNWGNGWDSKSRHLEEEKLIETER